MKKIEFNQTHFVKFLVITVLAIFMLINIASAAPYAYITNSNSNNVTVIDTATDTVTATVNVAATPAAVAVTPDGTKVYAANYVSNTVSVIDTTTNTVITTVKVGINPISMGQFIGGPKATPKIPTISWSNPVDIIYGTPLSSTQLNALATNPTTGASVPGTFTYNLPAGTILSAGVQTLHVDFTPKDTAYYSTASTSVQINVLTHVQKIQQMTTNVQSLNLDEGLANSLIVKLNAAAQNLNDKSTPAATNELNAFINEVEADIQSGKLTSTEGQALIDDANAVINGINYVLNSPSTSVPEFPSIALPVAACLGLVLILGRKKNNWGCLKIQINSTIG